MTKRDFRGAMAVGITSSGVCVVTVVVGCVGGSEAGLETGDGLFTIASPNEMCFLPPAGVDG